METERLELLKGIYRDRWNLLRHYSILDYDTMLQELSGDIYYLNKYLGTEEGKYDVFAEDLYEFTIAFNGFIQNNGRPNALYYLDNMDERRGDELLSELMQKVYLKVLKTKK